MGAHDLLAKSLTLRLASISLTLGMIFSMLLLMLLSLPASVAVKTSCKCCRTHSYL